MKARLQGIYAAGQAMGNQPGVFIKVGDSITESESFLSGIGCHEEHLAGHTDLAAVIGYFRRVTFPPAYTASWCQVANSFDRASVTAVTGWNSEDPLQVFGSPPDPACAKAPFDTPLTCELHLLKPSIALVMYGTNDVDRWSDTVAYRAAMTKITETIIAAGAIPVLSTIPPRPLDTTINARVDLFNRAVISVAMTERVPLWNYWRALVRPNMVNEGISGDGVHPSLYGGCTPSCRGEDFSAEGLRYGFNQRNFTAVEILGKILGIVFEDGPPDVATEPASPSSVSPSPWP